MIKNMAVTDFAQPRSIKIVLTNHTDLVLINEGFTFFYCQIFEKWTCTVY